MITALSLIALGFFLGMRHATDPDHVIAVSTIVTRQRTLLGGVLIGGLWGLGHTVTIFVVGGAIIVFSVVIPPALGLTMEMTVALMLVVLGLWNLTGLIQTVRDQLGGSAGVHAHVHRHGDYVHAHGHGHGAHDHGHRVWMGRVKSSSSVVTMAKSMNGEFSAIPCERSSVGARGSSRRRRRPRLPSFFHACGP